MKKLSTIILLLITLQYTFGLYTAYMFNSSVIKQHMHHAIASGLFKPREVVTLNMPLQNFKAAKAGCWQQDEISYNSKMYDIITAVEQKGRVVIKCLCDEDENNLTASFIQVLQKNRQFPDKRMSALSNIFSPFILADISYSLNRLIIRKIPFLQKQIVFTNGRCQHVPTPPPWQVS